MLPQSELTKTAFSSTKTIIFDVLRSPPQNYFKVMYTLSVLSGSVFGGIFVGTIGSKQTSLVSKEISGVTVLFLRAAKFEILLNVSTVICCN